MKRPHDVAEVQDEARIERWLNDRAVAPPRPDRDAVLAASLRQIPTTHQRRHRWSVRWLQPITSATRSANDGTNTTRERSRLMFSTANITAAIAVAAIGVAAILATGLPQGSETAPGRALLRGASEAATFSGTRHNDAVETVPATTTTADGVTSNRGQTSSGSTIEATDERFSGTMDFTFSADLYSGQDAGAFWGDQRITNDDGAWVGPLVGAGNPMGHWRASAHFVGEGGYEGLVAIVYFDSDGTFEGAIVPGTIPPRE